ncbi:MAG: DUF87 domain-containing protein [Thermofilum sp.]
MVGLRRRRETPAPRNPGGAGGVHTLTTPSSQGAGRGSEPRGAPVLKALNNISGGQHIAIVGATGCGKTTLARLLCSLVPRPLIVDWDGEYTDLGLPVVNPPYPLPDVDLKTLLSNIERPKEGGHGIAAAIDLACERTDKTTISAVANALRTLAMGGYAPQWIFATLARLAVLEKYIIFGIDVEPPLVYNLAAIDSIRERAIIQQAIATAFVLSRPLNPPDEILLVIEEGGMGATLEYLKDLIALARRRGIRLVYVSQVLPPEPLLPSFVLCLGDPGNLGAEWSRILGLPMPRLGRGEFLIIEWRKVRKVKVKF